MILLYSGNAFYDGLVGALAGLFIAIVFVIYKCFKKVFQEKNIFEKVKAFMKKESFEKTFINANNNTTTEVEPANYCEQSTKKFCKYCGKPVDSDARYCSSCGKNLSNSNRFVVGLPSTETFKKICRWIFVWILVAALSIITGLLLRSIPDAGDRAEYILPIFIAYLLYRVIAFTYSLNDSKRKILAISLAVLTSLVLGLIMYDNYSNKVEPIDTENAESINRTFYNCNLGDSSNSVMKQLKSENLHEEYSYAEDGALNDIVLTNVDYGKFQLDTLRMSFYDDKMFKVWMSFNIKDSDDQRNDWTYKDVYKMLYDKYSNHKQWQEYNNVYEFNDDRTKIRLFHTPDESYGKEYCVTLKYSDKVMEEKYEEKLSNGF